MDDDLRKEIIALRNSLREEQLTIFKKIFEDSVNEVHKKLNLANRFIIDENYSNCWISKNNYKLNWKLRWKIFLTGIVNINIISYTEVPIIKIEFNH